MEADQMAGALNFLELALLILGRLQRKQKKSQPFWLGFFDNQTKRLSGGFDKRET
jgi:hypothetical protein